MQFASPKTEKEIRNRSVLNEHIFDACSFSDTLHPLPFRLFTCKCDSFLVCLTRSFVHIYTYLKIYGVINVDFCVNCESVLFFYFNVHCFYRVHSVTENHQVCNHFTPFRNPTFICTTCFQWLPNNSVASIQNAQQSFFRWQM